MEMAIFDAGEKSWRDISSCTAKLFGTESLRHRLVRRMGVAGKGVVPGLLGLGEVLVQE